MATISISSPATASSRSSTPSLFTVYSHYTPKLPLHSLPKSSIFSPSIILRPINRTKPRFLTVVVSAVKKLSETDLVVVPSEPNAISGLFPKDSGVYAVYDSSSELQFVGISRNIAASILSHKKSLPELCSSVKFGVVDEPDRTVLTQSWKSWMEEHIATTGKVPPGNESGNTTWVRQQPKKKADLRLTPGRHVQLTVPLEDLIDRLVKENKVVAFIKGSRSAHYVAFRRELWQFLRVKEWITKVLMFLMKNITLG